ncbi:MAG TPA: fibronectin type III domain-containing protein [Anaeromyxobacteraceae bacterium]|nr:fibronectin type III domain-containing protein [Anaeromyxobacteraceae bacterium]
MSAVARLSSALLTASVLALAACGGSDSSSPPPPPPPAAPTGLTATPFNGAVALAWTPVTGATSYNVYRAGTAGLPLASMMLAGSPTHPAFNAETANAATWYFRVTAVNAGGESPPTDEVPAFPDATLLPAPPTGVTATAGDRTVTVAWDAVPGANSYKVYRALSPGVTTGGSYTACASSPCTVSLLTNATPYYFAVSAFINVDESALSAEVMATPRAMPYIDATAVMLPGGTYGYGVYQVEVCTDSSCFTPITNATVSLGGMTLAYDAGDEDYSAQPTASIAGKTLALVVTIPSGSAVAAGTYRASATMIYTKTPALTSPANGATWSASTSHTVSWTHGAPIDSSIYGVTLVNMSNPFASFMDAVPTTQNSDTIPGGTLVASPTVPTLGGTANHMVLVQLQPASGPMPITTAASGSRFTIAAAANPAFITVQ